jgi:hypothetical protein
MAVLKLPRDMIVAVAVWDEPAKRFCWCQCKRDDDFANEKR